MSVLCLVPTAQRAARVARRLCDAQDGVLLGTRVTTLESAAALVLAGGDSRPVLTPIAERLLCAEAARAAPLFASTDAESGTLRVLRRCLAELRRGEIRAEHLHAAARSAGAGAGLRIEALATVLAAYEERLDALCALDAASAMRAAAERASRASGADELRDLDLLVIEGFATLPPAGLDLALALTQRARRAQWRVPYFPGRADLSAVVEPIVRRIEGLHHVGGRPVDLVLEDLDDHGARAAGLVEVLRGAFGGSPSLEPPRERRLLLAPGAGEQGEAETAAGLLSRLVEGGFAPEELVVLAASSECAERVCDAADALHLPLNGRPRGALADEAPVRAVLEALGAAARPCRSTLEPVLASPYLGFARAPSRTGYWLDRAGASDDRGEPCQALRRRAGALTSPHAAPERGALLRTADALDEVSAELRPLGGPGLARAHAARLRGFLARSGIRRHAARAAPELARRDLQALARLDDLAEDVARALAMLGRGAEVLGAREWAGLLSVAARHTTLAAASEEAAGIEVTPVAEAPGLWARAAVLVGCARGAFPQLPTRDPLLGDPERLAVNGLVRRSALATSATVAAGARHAAFSALASARDLLCVTWPGPGPEGPGAGPAPVLGELSALSRYADEPLVPALPPARCSEATAVRVAAVRAAAARGRAGHAVDAASPGRAGHVGAAAFSSVRREHSAQRAVEGRIHVPFTERLESVVARAAVEDERRAAVGARAASRFSGGIPEALGAELQALLPRQWTPSQLEEHAICPFRFFVGTVLRASEPASAEPDIDPRDEGSLAHAVLERFYRARIAAGRARLVGAPEERQELVAAAQAVFASFEADGRTGDPSVWASRRDVVQQRLERVIAAEAERAAAAAPVLVEHRFGGAGGAPPLVFSDGTATVELRGRIDRIDASADGIVLVDYKDSRSPGPWREKLQREALGRVNFQVPAYLMAARRALPGRDRLEATYLLLRSAERVAPFAADAADPLFAVEPEARERARAEGQRPFADGVLEAVAAIRRGTLPIASRDCSGCAFGAVCRFASRAEDAP